MTKNEDLLTLKEAADFLRCNSKTIARLITKEILKAYRPHGTRKVLIKRSELYKYLESSEVSVS